MKNKDKKSKYWNLTMTIVCGAVFSVLLLGCGKREDGDMFQELNEETLETTFLEETEDASATKEQEIDDTKQMQEYYYVHVCGAVNRPGVYKLDAKSRCCDAVEKAGGFREDAAKDYLNMAAEIEDGSRLEIPTQEQVSSSESDLQEQDQTRYGLTSQKSDGDASTDIEKDRININTADISLLCQIPGVGESRAESIISFREENGNFTVCEDIMQVSGIKEGLYSKIKDRICVDP